jgi:hypothetical protein
MYFERYEHVRVAHRERLAEADRERLAKLAARARRRSSPRWRHHWTRSGTGPVTRWVMWHRPQPRDAT